MFIVQHEQSCYSFSVKSMYDIVTNLSEYS